MVKGIFQFILTKEDVVFHLTDGTRMDFPTLDDFIDYDFGCKGAAIFTTLSELNAIYLYLKSGNLNDKYNYSLVYVNNFVKKIIGLKIMKKDSKERRSFKMFYDIKYKLGSDELKLKDALNEIESANFKRYNSGYTGKLRDEIVVKEKICRGTINNPPSMAPNIYTKVGCDFSNVQCWDITSAYPYLLTQPLPHFVGYVDFESEEQFKDENMTYYGGIEIKQLKAKQPYFPLTLVGKNHKGLKIEDQGENINHQGVRIVSADRVVIYGFVPHLLEILKRNYDFESYRISKNLIKFKLEINWELRKLVLRYFERKQEKKRNNLNYSGEKILLNRLYGFFITVGSNAPAHYSQYVISKERLIIDDLINKIGFKDMVHAHTDSLKFIGDHEKVIEEYNSQIKFKELGKFVLEDVYQRCTYFSHITAKYIDKNGKLEFKHGGIDKIGIAHLYKMPYEEITNQTQYFLVLNYFYLKNSGYYPEFITSNFSNSVDIGGD